MATPPTRPTLRLPVHATVDKVETWARLAPDTARYHRERQEKLEAALAAAFQLRHPQAVEVAAGSEQRFAALAAAEVMAGSGRVPTRFLTFEDMVAYGMLPRFGSKVGFVHPQTVYAGTVLSRLIASRSVAVLGNSWRKERCSPATSCGRVYLTNLAELEPAKGDSGVKR